MISHRNTVHYSPHHQFPPCVSPPHQHFLLSAQTSSRKLSDAANNRNQQQFDPVLYCDQAELNYYKSRSQFRKRGTPKVIILCGDTGKPKVFVQKLQTSLLQILKKVSWREKILCLIDTFEILCELAREHGFFYVEKHMLKCNKKGEVVVWINQHFQANHREFAIRNSDVAEVIFVKRLKMTFSQVTVFPISSQIKTIHQMREFLKSQLEVESKQNFNFKKTQHTASYKVSPNSSLRTTETSKNIQNLLIAKNNSTSNFDFRRKYQAIKSKSPSKFRKLPDYKPVFKSPEKVSFRYKANKQKQDEALNSPKLLTLKKKDSNKARKCSADITTLTDWLKASAKHIERPYANSTFSANTKFSINTEAQQRRDKKPDSDESSPKQNPESRNRTKAENKNFYKNVQMEIQEEPLEQEVQNLFESLKLHKKRQPNQSEIDRDLDQLFESDRSSVAIEDQGCMQDFQAVLNN